MPAAVTRRYDWVVKRVAAVEHERLPEHLGTDLPSVPPDHVFLLGDAARSFDSRHWGPVRADALLGRAIWRFRQGAPPAGPVPAGAEASEKSSE